MLSAESRLSARNVHSRARIIRNDDELPRQPGEENALTNVRVTDEKHCTLKKSDIARAGV
jgi:hypothetical protein